MPADHQTDESASAPASAGVPSSTQLPPVVSDGSLSWRLVGVLMTLRPHQWVKNVFVLAPVVFAKEVFDAGLLLRAASAFAVFCLLAGSVYTLNDLADVEADRVHPVKRYRPIASGRVPQAWARALCLALVVVALGWAATLGIPFLAVTSLYFAQNVAYSLKLKHIAYIDVSCIALGFVLRVAAGGFATGISISRYLLLCTALLALFLGFGKRRHELTSARKARAALESYTQRGLDLALGISGIATAVCYLMYTLAERSRAFFHSDHLWVSTVFVVLGGLRFLFLVKNRPRAESPTQEMLRDGPFVAVILGWVALVMWMVYQLKPS